MAKNNRPKQLRDFPHVLVDLAMKYEEDGTILCLLPAEDFAGMLRVEFTLPTPLEPKDATCFVKKLVNINVYYQRRLEAGLNVRGFWLTFGDKAYIFIEADRPYPSQIRTLIHEVSEKLRAISFLLHPEVAQPKDTLAANQQREAWANRVAAAVKMPPELFKGQFAHFLLDVEELKRVNDETLAAVARRLRDLVMNGHVFYWCRFDLAPYGLLKCPKLAELAEILGGTCVRIADVTYVQKPLFSREGANVSLYRNGQRVTETPGTYASGRHVCQALAPVPVLDGFRPVIGSWVVGDAAHGMGIRESSGPITDNLSQFVPHIFKA